MLEIYKKIIVAFEYLNPNSKAFVAYILAGNRHVDYFSETPIRVEINDAQAFGAIFLADDVQQLTRWEKQNSSCSYSFWREVHFKLVVWKRGATADELAERMIETLTEFDGEKDYFRSLNYDHPSFNLRSLNMDSQEVLKEFTGVEKPLALTIISIDFDFKILNDIVCSTKLKDCIC